MAYFAIHFYVLTPSVGCEILFCLTFYFTFVANEPVVLCHVSCQAGVVLLCTVFFAYKAGNIRPYVIVFPLRVVFHKFFGFCHVSFSCWIEQLIVVTVVGQDDGGGDVPLSPGVLVGPHGLYWAVGFDPGVE